MWCLEMSDHSMDSLIYILNTWTHKDRLFCLLSKLGIKSAPNREFTIEPLDISFKSVTFDMKHIRMWNKGSSWRSPAFHKLCMLLHKFGIEEAKNFLPIGIDPNRHIEDLP